MEMNGINLLLQTKFEYLNNSYNLILNLIEPLLDNEKKKFSASFIKVITSQIELFIKVVLINEKEELYKLMNGNNQELIKSFSDLYDLFKINNVAIIKNKSNENSENNNMMCTKNNITDNRSEFESCIDDSSISNNNTHKKNNENKNKNKTNSKSHKKNKSTKKYEKHTGTRNPQYEDNKINLDINDINDKDITNSHCMTPTSNKKEKISQLNSINTTSTKQYSPSKKKEQNKTSNLKQSGSNLKKNLNYKQETRDGRFKKLNTKVVKINDTKNKKDKKAISPNRNNNNNNKDQISKKNSMIKQNTQYLNKKNASKNNTNKLYTQLFTKNIPNEPINYSYCNTLLNLIDKYKNENQILKVLSVDCKSHKSRYGYQLERNCHKIIDSYNQLETNENKRVKTDKDKVKRRSSSDLTNNNLILGNEMSPLLSTIKCQEDKETHGKFKSDIFFINTDQNNKKNE